MSATTTLQFTLTSPGQDPSPTPGSDPVPSNPGYVVPTSYTPGSPNTGENSAISDNGGGTVFAALFAVIGLAALAIFLVRYLKKNRHVSFAERGSFHISARPRVFATVALTLAVAFLGGITITNMYNNSRNTEAASQKELNVTVKPDIIFNTNRGENGIKSDTIVVDNKGAKYDLFVSTTDNRFLLDNTDNVYLASVSGAIAAPNASINTNQWGMTTQQASNPDVAAQMWAAAPTTETKIKSDATESSTPVTYAVNLGNDLPDGRYTTKVSYRAVAKNYKVTVINGFVNETGDKTEDWFDADVEVKIRQNCSTTFKEWSIIEGGIIKDDITSVKEKTYRFTMPARDVTVKADCEGDPEPTSAWEINYDANAPSGTTATGTMDKTTVTTNSTALRQNAFAITNYTFLGWACKKDATAADFTDSQSNITQAALEAKGCVKTPGNPNAAPATNDSYTLYAIWSTTTPDVPDKEWLQEVTPEICDSMNVLDTKTAKDRRDNKEYSYRKYADGRCWLLSDLAYEPANDVKLTKKDTDIGEDKTQTFAQLGGKFKKTDSGSVLYNYKAASAGEFNNQAKGINLSDSLCPASWKMPDSYQSSGETPGYGVMRGEFWRLALYNVGKANNGGSTLSDDKKREFIFAANDDAIYHGPHFTYNGAWDFSTGAATTSGGNGGSGQYASYYLSTMAENGKPAAFNPHAVGTDHDKFDINVTDPAHGSSLRCLLRTKTQITTRNAEATGGDVTRE